MLFSKLSVLASTQTMLMLPMLAIMMISTPTKDACSMCHFFLMIFFDLASLFMFTICMTGILTLCCENVYQYFTRRYENSVASKLLEMRASILREILLSLVEKKHLNTLTADSTKPAVTESAAPAETAAEPASDNKEEPASDSKEEPVVHEISDSESSSSLTVPAMCDLYVCSF